MTPENPGSEDIFGDTNIILSNYRQAIQESGIEKVVGLSSMGAQHASGTGNLVMSYMLEHAFDDTMVKRVFIRPAYYYSNWLIFKEHVEEAGVLPTFFPADLRIPMVAPDDVSNFIARIITHELNMNEFYELAGPNSYTPADIARIFSKCLDRKVAVQQIPVELWKESLFQAGFSSHAADEMIKMIQAVIDGKAQPKKDEVKKMPISFEKYLMEKMKKR